MDIPVIDIFAGPGGLGEGFASFNKGKDRFKTVLSIEKDKYAHATLTLRSFFRQFKYSGREVPDEYYDFLQRDSIILDDLKELYAQFPEEYRAAKHESKCMTLGGNRPIEQPSKINKLIKESLLSKNKRWVLLGGPPCQAFSIVGRSVVGGIRPNDSRVDLYKQYLRILAYHQPAAFVFENVRGLETATRNNQKIFEEIKTSLKNPTQYLRNDSDFRISKEIVNVRYRIYCLGNYDDRLQNDTNQLNYTNGHDLNAPQNGKQIESFLVKSEKHGIPQARHRVIIVGIREDIRPKSSIILPTETMVAVKEILNDLPKLRSGLSKERDSGENWRKTFNKLSYLLNEIENKINRSIIGEMRNHISKINSKSLDRGSNYVSSKNTIKHLKEWYDDEKMSGVFNHETRGHIKEDIERYLYVSTYTKVMGKSPKLQDFDRAFLPDHNNAKKAIAMATVPKKEKGKHSLFNDRFRALNANKPSPTITSHISKDGHAFIHPDPTQCRSLTVREAARIQTFPDNYYFCGGRTQQYVQVGNAVPPLLANKIAQTLYNAIWGD